MGPSLWYISMLCSKVGFFNIQKNLLNTHVLYFCFSFGKNSVSTKSVLGEPQSIFLSARRPLSGLRVLVSQAFYLLPSLLRHSLSWFLEQMSCKGHGFPGKVWSRSKHHAFEVVRLVCFLNLGLFYPPSEHQKKTAPLSFSFFWCPPPLFMIKKRSHNTAVPVSWMSWMTWNYQHYRLTPPTQIVFFCCAGTAVPFDMYLHKWISISWMDNIHKLTFNNMNYNNIALELLSTITCVAPGNL